MKWERLMKQLETILNTPIRLVQLSVSEWTKRFGEPDARTISLEFNENLYLYLEKRSQRITALVLDNHLLTPAERSLLEMHIVYIRNTMTKDVVSTKDGDEERFTQLGRWIMQQLEQGKLTAELPEQFVDYSFMYTSSIPILVFSDLPEMGKVTHQDFKKLLETFFGENIKLIPLLEGEWLILASESMLVAENGNLDDKSGEMAESLEDVLESICLGLHEMLATEWLGECHFSIYRPIKPVESIVNTLYQMRESIRLGRGYRLPTNVHLPWKMNLERLLDTSPTTGKVEFLERILKRSDHFLDSEMITTLEHFFELSCNVSDTAKQLYIHRNTLLYRLDKFKQETGLDVRNFNDAVLVRIALLLYKVTKRT